MSFNRASIESKIIKGLAHLVKQDKVGENREAKNNSSSAIISKLESNRRKQPIC